MALLNPYLNPFEQTIDEIDDILFISDRERIVLENKEDMILVDYRGIEIVRCSECGHKYPRDIPWCEECGSSKTEKIEYEER